MSLSKCGCTDTAEPLGEAGRWLISDSDRFVFFKVDFLLDSCSCSKNVFSVKTVAVWSSTKNSIFVLSVCFGERNQVWNDCLVWEPSSIIRTKVTAFGSNCKDHYNLQSLFDLCVLEQVKRILDDPSHILHLQYELSLSGRRYRAQRCKLNQFKNSFVPASICVLNRSLKEGGHRGCTAWQINELMPQGVYFPCISPFCVYCMVCFYMLCTFLCLFLRVSRLLGLCALLCVTRLALQSPSQISPYGNNKINICLVCLKYLSYTQKCNIT